MSKKMKNKSAKNHTGARSNIFYGNILDQKRYMHSLELINGKNVLDCACGVGWGSYLMAEAGAKLVVGVDISEDAISAANHFFSHEQITFKNDDLLNFENDYLFDIVTCFETIEHVDKPIEFLKKIHHLLHDSGILLLSTPNATCFKNPSEPPKNPYHKEEYNLDRLIGMCDEAGFAVQKRLGQYLINDNDTALQTYRDFIHSHWRDVKGINRFGLLFKVFIKFRQLFVGKNSDPALETDCRPTLVLEGMQPAYNVLHLKKQKTI